MLWRVPNTKVGRLEKVQLTNGQDGVCLYEKHAAQVRRAWDGALLSYVRTLRDWAVVQIRGDVALCREHCTINFRVHSLRDTWEPYRFLLEGEGEYPTLSPTGHMVVWYCPQVMQLLAQPTRRPDVKARLLPVRPAFSQHAWWLRWSPDGELVLQQQHGQPEKRCRV